MKPYINILQAFNFEQDTYVCCATEENRDRDFEMYKDIIKDCSEEEKVFLLKCLKNLKSNLRGFSGLQYRKCL
nr:hypothetical protein [uncultured Blautia sp.]